MPDSSSKTTDRRLGDEWENWNGDLDALEPEIPGPKRRFLLFAAIAALIVLALLGLVLYLVHPRLISIHPAAFLITGIIFALAGAYTLLGYVAMLISSAVLRIPFMAKPAQLFAETIRAFAFWIGKRFRISADRMGASYINVHNALIRAGRPKSFESDRVLVLLPRCLTRDFMRQARAISKEFGCKAMVADGGTVARKHIIENKPSAIVALACERDLVAGLQFTGLKYETLALSNKRPSGPCKNTEFDVDKFREMLAFFTDGKDVRQP